MKEDFKKFGSLESRAVLFSELIEKEQYERSKIPLFEQEIGFNFNEFERTGALWTLSSRIWRYMERMDMKPFRVTNDCRWYAVEKHQLVLKKRPAKQARCSKDSCTF